MHVIVTRTSPLPHVTHRRGRITFGSLDRAIVTSQHRLFDASPTPICHSQAQSVMSNGPGTHHKSIDGSANSPRARQSRRLACQRGANSMPLAGAAACRPRAHMRADHRGVGLPVSSAAR